MIGAVANIYKQNMIFPPPSGPSGSEDEKKQGMVWWVCSVVWCIVCFVYAVVYAVLCV